MWPFRKRTKEEEFWRWFVRNKEMVAAHQVDQERIFDALAAELCKVHCDLTFEVGGLADGTRDFVVSAAGIADAIPAVHALCDAAPKIAGWVVTRFRQRRKDAGPLGYGGLHHDPREILCALHLQEDGRIGIDMFIPGFDAADTTLWGQVGFLTLDHALGEFDVMTKAGQVRFFGKDAAPPEEMCAPAARLAEWFDRVWERGQERASGG